jgi:hypothetical protein
VVGDVGNPPDDLVAGDQWVFGQAAGALPKLNVDAGQSSGFDGQPPARLERDDREAGRRDTFWFDQEHRLRS